MRAKAAYDPLALQLPLAATPAAPDLAIPPTQPPAPSELRRVHSDTSLHLPPRHLPPRLPLRRAPTAVAAAAAADPVAASLFARRTTAAINDAAVCLQLSLGHHTGLLAALAARSSSAPALAAATGLHPPLVHEWLRALHCAGLLRCSAAVYSLPPEYAALLAPRGANVAALARLVPVLARLQPRLERAFRTGRPLAPSHYAEYDDIVANDLDATVGPRLADAVLPRVPGLDADLRAGCCVLCLGGAAHVVYARLAARYPRSWFTCYVASPYYAGVARAGAGTERGASPPNVHFKCVEGGLEALLERRAYEVALVLDGGAVRESADAVAVMAAVRRALRPGRCVLYVEVAVRGGLKEQREHPAAVFLCATRGLRGVGGGMQGTGGLWGSERAQAAMVEAGFADVNVFDVGDDGLYCLLVAQSDGGSE